MYFALIPLQENFYFKIISLRNYLLKNCNEKLVTEKNCLIHPNPSLADV